MNNQSTAPQAIHAEIISETDVEFHVTYFDAECGRAQLEVFATVAEAERFASRWCSDEDSWAVVDAVEVGQVGLAA